ncbi:MAG: CRISPR-associated endonuclease Cas2 [Desulfovibrionaceae bacterium]|nr:CRISPR-associated endonuclease Cas2 [Desulfovibrionaceae bacterium]
MLVVVSYDVSTTDPEGPKRLRRVAKACESWGVRVQNSVFECLVDPAQWVSFRAKLVKIIDPDRDSLRFYFLGSNWQKRVEHAGANEPINQEGTLIV